MKLLKSQRIALDTIKRLTVDLGRKNSIITNKQFDQKGLKGRHAIIKATDSLLDLGLICKEQCNSEAFRMDENWIGNDKYFRYQIKQKTLLCMF